jgi:holliday junction DNA helicase RuvA
MIASLRGKIILAEANRVVVEAQGVGYDVAVSVPTREALARDGEVFLHVYTAVRDNALELYGFTTLEEKKLFEMLLSVAGVGPRTALQVLSGISPEGLRRAVAERDSRHLMAIPGIGKKSAERIILELQEKIKKLPAGAAEGPGRAEAPSLEDDLISSLINLGYAPRAAEHAAKKVLKAGGPGLTLSEAVRLSLKDSLK